MDNPMLRVPCDIRASIVPGLRLPHGRLLLAAAGIQKTVVESVLGHARPGLVRTYQRYYPLQEMRKALEKWGQWLEGLGA